MGLMYMIGCPLSISVEPLIYCFRQFKRLNSLKSEFGCGVVEGAVQSDICIESRVKNFELKINFEVLVMVLVRAEHNGMQEAAHVTEHRNRWTRAHTSGRILKRTTLLIGQLLGKWEYLIG